MNTEQVGKYYTVSALGALAELSLGLPLDRIKVSLQSRIPIEWKPSSLRETVRYWYAGNVPSLIQRCGIYLPAIQLSNTFYNKIIRPTAAARLGNKTSELVIKPLIITSVVSPYVALFEGLKTAQQIGPRYVYPDPVKPHLMGQGIRDIIRALDVSRTKRYLFAGIVPTFGREFFFISGMCVVQPVCSGLLYQFAPPLSLMDSKPTVTLVGSIIASLVCQTASQPLDVLKTRCELRPSLSLSSQSAMLYSDCWTLGFRKVLYSGWLPRVTRGTWTFTCLSLIRDYFFMN